jgi:hypothetical protein
MKTDFFKLETQKGDTQAPILHDIKDFKYKD